METIQNFINKVSMDDFNYPQYLLDNRKEIISSKPPAKPVYKVETRSKATRIAIEIILGVLSVLFLPYGFYRLIHLLGGKIIVPAQWNTEHDLFRERFCLALFGMGSTVTVKDKDNNKHHVKVFSHIAKEQKGGVSLKEEEKVINLFPPLEKEKTDNYLVAKRISVLVDGKKIDAVVLGRKNNLNNKRWTLFSNGNGTTLEGNLAYSSGDIVEQINKLGTNFLLYNYQGVGASEGWSTRNGMVNAHKAMLKFLEDEKKGIGAKEIIQRGISIGAGVQGHAMKTHKIKKDIKYVFVKNQTFSQLSKVPGPFLGSLMKFFGWELSSVSSSKKLEKEEKPEIIIQTAHKVRELKAEQIKNDGRIPKRGAHAYRLLSLKEKWKHKVFIGTSAMHCEMFDRTTTNKIFASINHALQTGYAGFHP